MKTLSFIIISLVIPLCAWTANPPALSVRNSTNGTQLSWPGVANETNGTISRPWFEVQRSVDLQRWQPVGQRLRAPSATPDSALNLLVPRNAPAEFYRLLSIPVSDAAPKLANDGAEVHGYADAFARELQRVGQISVDEFAARFSNRASYLGGISWNPTNGAYWPQFNVDPFIENLSKQPGQPGYRTKDYRLNPTEQRLFEANGFVVSERLGDQSFAATFYDLWHNDLPVFISTDAILQAWHRTYDGMLEELEETYLFNAVETMLEGMAAQLPQAASAASPALQDSIWDADYFIAVARSLLAGRPVASHLNQDPRVAETLADITAQQLKQVPNFMGFCRIVDFSQFKIRGHYEHSERLGRYFKCVMWLGRIDFPVAGGPFRRCPFDDRMASPRELGSAIVLWHLLKAGGQFDNWRNLERVIETFVGWTDSLNFGQIDGLLAGAGIRSLTDVPDLAALQRIQLDIARGELGIQNITSDWFAQPTDVPWAYKLPQTFTVFGQKFIPDSWAFSQTVFNNITWVQDGQTNLVQRRVPGALDAAFAVLANDQIVPQLTAQMNGTFADPIRPHATRFRDGKPYQHNLAAVRAVMDAQRPDVWENNLYMNWLACLRELSAPTTGTEFPEVMRTRGWAMKTLNTQLASWTHLRHDTILYSKQSYTFGFDGCLYPTGFVEPRVSFWRRLNAMATRTAELIGALSISGSYPVETSWWRINPVTSNSEPVIATNFIPLTLIQSNQVAHLRRFADTTAMLQRMSEKELAHQCFDVEEELFVRNLIEHVGWIGAGCARGPDKYSGWFPQLFYRAIHWSEWNFHDLYGAGAFDALVADVHTDVPCEDCPDPDPGSVLHQGVGRVNLLIVAIDNGGDRFICAGPVLSHYEFEVTGEPRRITDTEWKSGGGSFLGPRFGSILNGDSPPDVSRSRIEGVAPPVWTESYLVPQPRQ